MDGEVLKFHRVFVLRLSCQDAGGSGMSRCVWISAGWTDVQHLERTEGWFPTSLQSARSTGCARISYITHTAPTKSTLWVNCFPTRPLHAKFLVHSYHRPYDKALFFHPQNHSLRVRQPGSIWKSAIPLAISGLFSLGCVLCLTREDSDCEGLYQYSSIVDRPEGTLPFLPRVKFNSLCSAFQLACMLSALSV